MKNTCRFLFAVVLAALFSVSGYSQIRQTKLYIDDGFGHFTVLTAPLGGGAVTFPSSGTLLSSANTLLNGTALQTPGDFNISDAQAIGSIGVITNTGDLAAQIANGLLINDIGAGNAGIHAGLIFDEDRGSLNFDIIGTNASWSADSAGDITAGTAAISTAPGTTNDALTIIQNGSGQDISGDSWGVDKSGNLSTSGTILIDASNSSNAFPSILGMSNMGHSGNAARWQFGDQYNSIQNAFGDLMQVVAWHGIEIHGNDAGASVGFVSGGGEADVSIVGGSNNSALTNLQVMRGSSGQSFPIQEWTDENGNSLASVSAAGNISTTGTISSVSSITSGNTLGNAGAINITNGGSHTATITNSSGSSGSVSLPTGSGPLSVVYSGTGTLVTGTKTINITGVLGTDIVVVSYTGIIDANTGALSATPGGGTVVVQSSNGTDDNNVNVIVVRP